jgi:hypothetical protein
LVYGQRQRKCDFSFGQKIRRVFPRFEISDLNAVFRRKIFDARPVSRKKIFGFFQFLFGFIPVFALENLNTRALAEFFFFTGRRAFSD